MLIIEDCKIPLRGVNEVASATLGRAKWIILNYSDKMGLLQEADLSPNTPAGHRKMMQCLKDSINDELTVVKLCFLETESDKEAVIFSVLDELDDIEMRLLSVVIDVHMTSVSDDPKKALSMTLSEIVRIKQRIKEDLELSN